MPVTEQLRKSLLLAYKMKPVRGLAYLKKRGKNLIETWDYDDLSTKMHSKAFTVAKSTGANILQDIYEEIQKAKAKGTSVDDFINNLKPRLQEKGWWGTKTVEGKKVQLGTPSRLALILDTNIKTSHAQGRYESMMAISKYRPWWVYEQIHRPNARESHKQFDKKIFHYTNPIIKKIFPPRGFGCDCTMRAVDDKEKDRLIAKGYKLVDKGKETNKLKITEEQKNFDPIGDYEPETKNYEPEIKDALKEAQEEFEKKEKIKNIQKQKSNLALLAKEILEVKKIIEKLISKDTKGKTAQKAVSMIKTYIEQIGTKIKRIESQIYTENRSIYRKILNGYAALSVILRKTET
jgi:uncharacterized protein with gpF-like domain